MNELSGKVALVTGASRGIGWAIASALLKAGARVALTYHQERARPQELLGSLGAPAGDVMAVQMAIQDRDSVRRGMGAVRETLGPVTVLVNNAGIAQEKPFDTITDDDWDQMLAVNLRGAFTCCQEVLPDMLEINWGRIINITSIGGQWGGFNQVHYAAAKAGLISLTRSLARIYSGQGVTTNAVAPGLVATDMASRELDSDAGKKKVEDIPAGRIATADEIANAVVFLATDGAGYITGQTINVNGGMYFG